ncbi:MAG: cytochrome ubiquinol oxidase subunit I [Chloroflexota bacterium]
MGAEELARLQFALTIGFHFFFSSLSIGISVVLFLLETMRWRTKKDVYDRAAVFFTKIFALTFAIGVATGIAMEFQFGTNWASYSTFVGDIFGAPLAAEGVLAFFLESTFLGILVFGRGRVSSGVRWAASFLVMFGALLSGLWILIANSWMQTPAGYEIVDGRARLTDFWAAALNPSTIPRYMHTISAGLCAGAFFAVAVMAWYVLRKKHIDVVKVVIPIALVVSFIGAGLMFATGDTSARQVANTQVAKFAGMNGLYDTTVGAPLTIWALPPAQTQAAAPIGPAIVIANMLSFMTFGSFTAAITGLNEFPADQWPPVAITFLSYHNMVILGTLMALLMLSGVYLLWRRKLYTSPRWMRMAVVSPILPILAIQLGWMTAEVGRQPWIVYGVMRTADGVSTVVPPEQVAISIGLLVGMYVLLGGLYLYLLRKELGHGPDAGPDEGTAAQGLELPGSTAPKAA